MSNKKVNLKEVGLAVGSMHKYLKSIGELNDSEREILVDQALILIGDIYVHLPLKRAMHAVEPIQRLKLLKYRNSKLDERTFHDQMISIFMSLRDIHTRYLLPDPYNKLRVFLPFFIEEFYKEGEKQFIVSKVSPDFSHATFKPGVLVTHWNGIPIHRAIQLNGERYAGSNEEARFARGLDRMTVRPLSMLLPPDEEWVEITYLAENGHRHSLRFNWKITPPPPVASMGNLESADLKIQAALGLDYETEAVRRIKKALFAFEAMKTEKKIEKYIAALATDQGASPKTTETGLLPDNLSARTVSTSYGDFGYIRIYSFNVIDDSLFVSEFIKFLAQMPKKGLIIDVRGNGGGLISAGEKILQLLTPRKIQPTNFSFINTPLMLELCKKYQWLSQWTASIDRSIETGAVFSQAFPLEPLDAYNQIGQKYTGPVILITDALCYSTTDIFAAGFQDNKIGPILGVHGNTGAGGANVWTHSLLKQLLPDNPNIFSLPKGASFRVSIRRTTRTGENMGMPIEDLGVIPDHIHHMTGNDLLNQNADLIKKAAGILNGNINPPSN